MSFLFGSDTPPPQAAPAPPAADPAAVQAQQDAAMAERQRQLAIGRGSTNPTGGTGDTSSPNLAAKSLLGQ